MANSLPVRIVLHFLNARPTERNWRQLVESPFRRNLGPRPQKDASPLGVGSVDQLKEVLAEFQDLAGGLAFLDRANVVRRRMLLAELYKRVPLKVEGYGFDQRARRLTLRSEPPSTKFSDVLSGNLVLAMLETRILRCEQCHRFFADGSQRRVKFCSRECSNRVAVLRYRERHPEQYREYQRDLMRMRSRRRRKSSHGTRAATSIPLHGDGSK